MSGQENWKFLATQSTKNDVCRWQTRRGKGTECGLHGKWHLNTLVTCWPWKSPPCDSRSRRGPHSPWGWGACTWCRRSGPEVARGRPILTSHMPSVTPGRGWTKGCPLWCWCDLQGFWDLLSKPMVTGWGILRLRPKGLLAGSLLPKPWSMQRLRGCSEGVWHCSLGDNLCKLNYCFSFWFLELGFFSLKLLKFWCLSIPKIIPPFQCEEKWIIPTTFQQSIHPHLLWGSGQQGQKKTFARRDLCLQTAPL